MRSSQKGSLKDRLKNQLRIFLNNLKIKYKKKKKIEERNKKECETKKNKILSERLIIQNNEQKRLINNNVSFVVVKKNNHKKLKNSVIPVKFLCKINHYYEYYTKVGISDIYSNDGVLLAKISYNEYGVPFVSYINENYSLDFIKERIQKMYGMDICIDNNLLIKSSNTVKRKENVLIIKEKDRVLNKNNNEETLTNIDKFIDASKDEVVSIKYELNLLDENLKNINDITIKELKEKYIFLIEKINKIKEKYNKLKIETDLFEFDLLNDSILWDDVNYYNYINETSSDVINLSNISNNSLEKLVDIIYLSEKNINNVMNKKEEYTDIKTELFNKGLTKTNDLFYIDNLLVSHIEKIERKLKEISLDVDNIDVVKRIYNERNINDIFSNLGKMTLGFLTIPFSRFRIGQMIIGAAMLNNGIVGLRNSIRGKTKTKLKYVYKDYSSLLKNYYNSLNNLDDIIVNSLSQIEYFKNDFYDKYGYFKSSDEYQDVMNKIDDVKNRLLIKRQEISIQKDYAKVQKDKNKVKMKKLKNFIGQ